MSGDAIPERTIALVGIDWGTTNRRTYGLAADGACVVQREDDQGMLACSGRFESSLGQLLATLGPLEAGTPVLMSGMVGSRQGWREAPYLDCSVALTGLAGHLVPVAATSLAARCLIVPGYRHDTTASVDVLRGEETQLLGALDMGCGDGWYVLPGTHSKWVELRDGCIRRFATYLTGELFGLLSAHGTLAPLMQAEQAEQPAPPQGSTAFGDGVALAGQAGLSHALFTCRARVVAGRMPAADTRDFVSGLLIGAEWADVFRQAGDQRPAAITLIGTPALSALYARMGGLFNVTVNRIDPSQAQLAALRRLARSI